jgi:nitroimidazol reductase NimA-like FMN-containing flavoprotein (pyridoxamine 5'-phosphate oxidase superfamily)
MEEDDANDHHQPGDGNPPTRFGVEDELRMRPRLIGPHVHRLLLSDRDIAGMSVNRLVHSTGRKMALFSFDGLPYAAVMTEHSSTIPVTDRTRLQRMPKRGVFDRETMYRILDEGFVCHVAFIVEGQPYVIPTAYARVGDALYLHGSAASRMLRTLADGVDVCVTVTLVDGLVLARSAFHHSMNYRSVVVLGRARLVEDAQEKTDALRAFTNHVVPDRWDELRPVTGQELKGTSVLALPIVEASAKVRTGPPIDDDEDVTWPTWAGVVPLTYGYGDLQADAHVTDRCAPFDVDRLRRRGTVDVPPPA